MNAKDAMIEDSVAVADQEFPWLIQASASSCWTPAHGHYQGGVAMKVFQPSSFLKQEDLEGNDWVVTVKHVTKELIKSGDGTSKEKFVVHFNECKPLVLNKTNMTTLIALMGTNESDLWAGKRCCLFVKEDVEFGGKLVSAIRIRTKAPL